MASNTIPADVFRAAVAKLHETAAKRPKTHCPKCGNETWEVKMHPEAAADMAAVGLRRHLLLARLRRIGERSILMPKDYRETTINIDHDARTASVWTTSRRIRAKLHRLGAKPSGVWLVLPMSAISIRKPAPKRGSGATNSAQLAAARVTARSKT